MKRHVHSGRELRSKFRIKTENYQGQRVTWVKFDDTLRLGSIVNNQYVPRTTPQTMAWLAEAGNAAELDDWLTTKLATPPDVAWPPMVPMQPVPRIAVAYAPPGADPVAGWHYWSIIPNWDTEPLLPHPQAGWTVYRAADTTELDLPTGWTWADPLDTSADDIAAVESFRKTKAEENRRKIDAGEISDDDAVDLEITYRSGLITPDTVRAWRGDPYLDENLLHAALACHAGQASMAAAEHFDSRHSNIVIRAYGDKDKQRWTAHTGIGGFMTICPGAPSYATKSEAITAGIAWWRAGVVHRISEIAKMRGGTCAWGWRLNVRQSPEISVYDWNG
ncbi:hypothetical protein ACQE3D_25350 (plasmid) [Methylomonas sp. MS20]|uniref:hypothetical protein n=1 Tax=Methylomonas sp. MS20 TaxID=3418769 RepID=UPI003CFDB3CC